MTCPRCGSQTTNGGRCARCGAAHSVGVGVSTPPLGRPVTPLPESTDDMPTGFGELPTGFGDQPPAPSTEEARHPLTVGQTFGPRYHIIRLLGTGGMGAVYQAWDTELQVAVAVKVIRPDVLANPAAAADIAERFKRELVLARQVTHRNVVRIHDIGEIDGIKYITMAYVNGVDLATLLANKRLPIARTLRIARSIVSGLAAAHAAGVVHRDLKPANIMIDAEDDAVIMDFGIARSVTEAAVIAATTAALPGRRIAMPVHTGITSAHVIVGTAEYMAPEQAKGLPVDQRADGYALGLILYDALAGKRRAGAVANAFAELQARIAHPPPPLRSIAPDVPEAFERIISRCLETDPAKRFATTVELAAALEALDEDGAPLPVRRTVGVRAVAAIALVVLALAGGGWWYTRTIAPPPEHEPVSVLIADFQNNSGDTALDGALEPVLRLALEGAGFISAYDHAAVRRSLGVRPPENFDERAAQELAVKQGLGVVVAGVLDHTGGRYGVTLKATHAVTGNVIATASDRAANKQDVLAIATKLASVIRQALGDRTSADPNQRFAMETLSATSLEVVHDYAAAAQAMSDNRFEEALRHFSQAVARDPKFGLAYAGMASASRNLDRQQDAARYIKEAVRYVDGMTERERYRTRGVFYMVTGDYQQCVKEFGELIARYAADASARNNMAVCLASLRAIPRAVDEMRRVVTLLPKRALYRVNLAHYANYSGDFASAEREVRAMPEPGVLGLLALAYAQLGQGRTSEAAQTYEALGKVDAFGASYAASGLGDLALYEGRLADAVRILSAGAEADIASKDLDRAATKLAVVAYAQVVRQQKPAAIAAAEAALTHSTAVKIRFLAARVFVEAGATARAQALAKELSSELLAEPQAYAKIIEGELALQQNKPRDAIKALTDANALLDTWIGHFDLGRAYLGAEAFTQADSEFDRVIKRRGEAIALFLDEEPTYGYLPPVYYFQGRARQGLNAGFAESYRTYLGIRGQSSEDPVVPDARRRVQ